MNIIFIVSVIEPVSVLKIEFFSVRLEISENDEVRDLESMFFSARFDTRFRELLRPLNSESCGVRVEPSVNEAVTVLDMESVFPRLDPTVIEAVRDCVYATLPFKSTAMATHAELVPRHSALVTEVLPVLSNPEEVILVPPPAEA